jgi:hypothetical protein
MQYQVRQLNFLTFCHTTDETFQGQMFRRSIGKRGTFFIS